MSVERPTPREEKFLAGIIQGKRPRQAYLDADYSPAHGGTPLTGRDGEAWRALLKQRLDAHGLTMDAVIPRLGKVMDARKMGITPKGDVVDMGEDAHASAKGLDMYFKITGSYPDPRLEISGADGGAIVVRHTRSLLGNVIEGSATDVTPPPNDD